MHEKFADRGLVVLAPQVDDRGDAAAYMAEYGYTFTALPDAGEVTRAFGVTGIPMFVIVGVDGTILYRHSGWGTGVEEEMAAIIDEELTPKS